jgi:hypothetical protein
MDHPAPRELFRSQLSLENIFNRRNSRKEVLGDYSGAGKRIRCETSLDPWPESRRRSPGAQNVFAA